MRLNINPSTILTAIRATAGLALVALVTACSAQIDRHGHVFTDIDLAQIQPGMSKDQVKLALGTPDTTATVGGDVYYYISSTNKTQPFRTPKVIDRKVLAVFFNPTQSVTKLANYGLKDGRVFDYIKGETPSHGKELNAIQQLFGNFANRKELLRQGGVE